MTHSKNELFSDCLSLEVISQLTASNCDNKWKYSGTILRAIYILNLESEASILNKWSIKDSEFVAQCKQNKDFIYFCDQK